MITGGRQSGKTTRLIDHVVDHTYEGRCVVLVMNRREAMRIEGLLRDRTVNAPGFKRRFEDRDVVVCTVEQWERDKFALRGCAVFADESEQLLQILERTLPPTERLGRMLECTVKESTWSR